MTTSEGPSYPIHIRARIHDQALKRVNRMYAATLAEIFTELLQNARRAGASQVRATIRAEESNRVAITVSDDGDGITDPAVLLSFGENAWDDDLVRREDAAGMGMLSLARHGCRVSSRPRTETGSGAPGWSTVLEPRHFLGEADARIEPDDAAPAGGGTSVRFVGDGTVKEAVEALSDSARHFPLPVILEGDGKHPDRELERQKFLDGAVYVETWRGLEFGVFRDRPWQLSHSDLNFHGLVLRVHLPDVATVHGSHWSLRVDVRDCPDLELVLPARRELVESGFPGEMRDAGRLAIYRAMAAHPDPRPCFEDWQSASAAGIRITPPPAVLRSWQPPIAEFDDWRDVPPLLPAGPDALVMDFDPEPPEAQTLWRAAIQAGLAPHLFEPDKQLAGYGWYDKLARITATETWITTAGDDERNLEGFPSPSAGIRPDAIRIRLRIEQAGAASRTLDLAADLAFAGDRSILDRRCCAARHHGQ